MPKSNAASTAGGMFRDLKSRLGFSREDDGYDDFDEYDDFDDDSYSAQNDREYAGYGSDYDDSAPVGAYKPATAVATARSSRFGRPDSTPDLVSLDDVKAHTQVPNSLMRDPLASSGETRTTRRANGRDLVENTGPAQSSPAYNAAKRERDSRSRSEGLDSLFEPTKSSRGSAAYDPYEAYSSSNPSSYSSVRTLTVVKPLVYADVERVSRALKAGDVVVLSMRNTPDDLSKRILDFSFGVASALDANVECPAEKVFAIARGRALDEDEKRTLRNQGVM